MRDYCWPQQLSVAVLSAKYGIIGGLSHICTYDQRMTPERAAVLASGVTRTLTQWQTDHSHIDLILGKDYLRAIDQSRLGNGAARVQVVEGAIGLKLNSLHALLRSLDRKLREVPTELINRGRPLYFLPDWDDFLDVEYDFETDTFSADDRSSRMEEHAIALMRPHRLCDGILISLAQNLGTKGLLKRVSFLDKESLSPTPVRKHFKLLRSQWAFGDCGAFSYVAEDKPTVSVEQAVSLYDLYEFDLGASVDHIPVVEVTTDAGRRKLSEDERLSRVRLTRDNAERFIALHRERGAKFLPVGVIQGLVAQDYARQLGEYTEMGYRYVALGGLVPRSDVEIRAVVDAVAAARKTLRRPPWIHLLGVFRPHLQTHFRTVGIGSFDSATYFRKAWLRSDQNYLGVDGNWYAAIRVPPLSDPRTRKRMEKSGASEKRLLRLEAAALSALRAYDSGTLDIDAAVAAVMEYDRLLSRAGDEDSGLEDKYRRTLAARPWRQCRCPVCRQLGIEVVIFRGINRNKRRGAHNTLQLFRLVRRRSS
ncbi:MAG: tRNA-guanine transglycosylase DpdA [Thermoguttaceae bacterium]|nr:tRNA-guanine transglycosylase DpdA [Thermoguttaceae bacterium]